ncbi:unnamed protein product [Schistosoma margrebowiei]|uniref:Uncharacterized protein n=1 Tax=Schistosoma margrebowiei TaxID=48269 RepID=A0A183MJE0_9TREM|nr:unnamed protein product [Schistosoma margrebowiei]
MESSRPKEEKEERKNKEHITPRNGYRHNKNEQELDRTRKESRVGQSELKNASRWPFVELRVFNQKCNEMSV